MFWNVKRWYTRTFFISNLLTFYCFLSMHVLIIRSCATFSILKCCLIAASFDIKCHRPKKKANHFGFFSLSWHSKIFVNIWMFPNVHAWCYTQTFFTNVTIFRKCRTKMSTNVLVYRGLIFTKPNDIGKILSIIS